MLSETFGGASEELKPITMPSLVKRRFFRRRRRRLGRTMSTEKACINGKAGVGKLSGSSLS